MMRIDVNHDTYEKLARISEENDLPISKVVEILLEGDILMPEEVVPAAKSRNVPKHVV